MPADGVVAPRPADLLALRVGAGRGPTTAGGRPGPGAHRASRAGAGRGLDFAESRPYQRGDDARSIDWRVTARQGRPHTKVFEAERERPLWLVVDQSASLRFGTRRVFKRVAAAEAAAWFAFRAAAAGDRIAGLRVDDDLATLAPPAPGERGALNLVALLCDGRPGLPKHRVDGLAGALALVDRRWRAGDRVVVVSDFYGLGTEPSGGPLRTLLARLSARSEVWLVQVADPLELAPPPPGRYPLATAGGTAWVDAADPAVRAGWAAPFAARRDVLAGLAGLAARAGAGAAGADGPAAAGASGGGRRTSRHLVLRTDADVAAALAAAEAGR